MRIGILALLLLLSGCGTGPGGYAWGNAVRGMAAGSQSLYGGSGYQPRTYVYYPPVTSPNFQPPMQLTHSTTCSSMTNSTGYTQTTCY